MTTAVSRSSVFLALREMRSHKLLLVSVVVLSILAGLAETGVLVVFVASAQGIASGEERAVTEIGPLSLSVGPGRLAVIGVVLVVVFFLTNVAVVLARIQVTRRWEMARRDEVVGAFLAADYPGQTTERQGHLQMVASGWVSTASGAATQLVQLARSSFSLAIFVGASLLADVRVTVAMVVFGGGMALLMLAFRRRARAYARQAVGQQAVLATDLVEAEGTAREIRVFGAEATRTAQLGAKSAALARARSRSGLWGGVATPLYQATGLLVLLVSLAVASTLDGLDVATLGASALLLYRGISYGQLAQVSLQGLDQMVPYFERIDRVVTQWRARALERGGDDLGDITTIRVEELSYRYGTDQPWALRDVTFDVDAGEVVGLVGPSGSGKSTLAQVLLRLRDPSTGEYFVNGVPASCFSLDSWARKVSLVPQDTKILSTTIFDNIVFERAGLTVDDVERAAAQAGLAAFVSSLPEGLHTMIGSGERELSGGQAQRLGIARALVSRPSFVVLDEPTSALDHGSEAVVQETIRRLRGQLTLVIIAHRLTTLDVCDRIVRLDAGRVAEIDRTEAVLKGIQDRHSESTGLR